jgi:hypothetical protein
MCRATTNIIHKSCWPGTTQIIIICEIIQKSQNIHIHTTGNSLCLTRTIDHGSSLCQHHHQLQQRTGYKHNHTPTGGGRVCCPFYYCNCQPSPTEQEATKGQGGPGGAGLRAKAQELDNHAGTEGQQGVVPQGPNVQ